MRLKQLAALTTSLAVLTACGGGTASNESESSGGIADMEPITLRMSTHEGPDTATGLGFEAFKEYVEKESDGQITVENFLAGSLVGPADALKATGAGTADVAQLITSYWPQDLPVSGWLLRLGATADPSLPYGTLQQSAAINEMFLSDEALIDEYEKQNIKVLNA